MPKTAGAAITEVRVVDEKISEIRFGTDDYLLVPACIDRAAASQWLASMRRVEGVELQFGKPGPTARLKGATRVPSRSRGVPLSTALGLLDKGVKGKITITRNQDS
tara:strand:- start:74 stop:391 length:318 start_codon:yes stop_codon:yes gene_type:complete